MNHLTSTEPVEIDHGHNPFASETVTRIYSASGYKMGQKAAIHALQQGRSMLYAMRTPDGLIKIGITTDLVQRRMNIRGEILGFRFGDLADELTIHHSLSTHVHHGREWYNATPEVLAVVNEMRAEFNLEPIAA